MEAVTGDTRAGDSSPSCGDDESLKVAEILKEQNPLTIDLVLTELFRNLPQNDLARCRLVSRQWYEESLPAWRDTATLTLKRGNIIMDKKKDDAVSLEQFLQYWEASGAKPLFRQFTLEDWNCWEGGPAPDPFDTVRFWEQIGRHITRLLLTNHQFSCLKEFRKVVYQLCPNMKYLKITNCKVQGTNFLREAQEQTYQEPAFGEHLHLTSLRIFGCYPDSWPALLSHFASLNSVIVDCSSDVATRNFLLAVRTVRSERPGKLPLKDCYFELLERSATSDSADIFQLLLDLQLPLRNFVIEMGEGRELETPFRDILRDHSQTIERLLYDNAAHCPCPQFPFGLVLNKLKMLVINDIGFCSDFHFLKSTPNLADLRFTDDPNARGLEVFANTAEEEMANVSLSKVKTLQLECAMTAGADDVRRLGKWMPNVEMAALILDDGKLCVVCKNWRGLKGLFDSGTELTDQGLLGIGREEGEEEASLPNLTHLKCLEYFGTKSQHLTKESATSGFLKMSSLKAVSVHKKSPLMTSGGGRSLREEGIQVDTEFDSFVEYRLNQDV